MKVLEIVALSGFALWLSLAPSQAGPCAEQIFDAQSHFDAHLKAVAVAGRTAAESTDATMHRQPTPGSLAQAEESLGELSHEKAQAFAAAMKRARAADDAGDVNACERAVAEARKALGN